MEAVALVDTLADKVAEFGAKKYGDKLGFVESKAPVETVVDTLARLKA